MRDTLVQTEDAQQNNSGSRTTKHRCGRTPEFGRAYRESKTNREHGASTTRTKYGQRQGAGTGNITRLNDSGFGARETGSDINGAHDDGRRNIVNSAMRNNDNDEHAT